MTLKPQFAADYRCFMSNILEKGYAELVAPENLVRPDGKVWFIPHHGVYHPHKPDKIRVVFDCSAQFQGISLNSQLLQGPDLTNSLLSVLLRFRKNEIGLMADIESMFYQVRVPEDDRDCLRPLWWPDGDIDQDPLVYRMTVHLFRVFSSPSCSNAALRQTADDNNHAFAKNVVDTVKHSFYVDDCLVSVTSEEEAVDLIVSLTDLCQKGGFRLTKWSSNNRKALGSVENDERSKGLKTLNLDYDKLPSERALGIHWVTEEDIIGFKFQISLKPPTKRGILSTVSSIYDPLGLAAPFILIGIVILQNLCKLGLDWDQEIPENVLTKWHQWVSELPLLENITLARCYKPIDFGEVVQRDLHVFSDASENGYGVAIYLRLTNAHQDHHCILVLGKSRVTPLKRTTIPRMELTAATTGVRLSRLVCKELDLAIHRVYSWTGSMSVIRYVSNEITRFSTFVANRKAVIRDGSNPDQWRYVESKLNPADSASRGINIKKFLVDKEWLNGPRFLWQPELHWPQTILSQRRLSEDDVEITSAISHPAEQSDAIHSLINRHSDWLKLRRVMGLVVYAVEKFKSLLSQDRMSKEKINLADSYLRSDNGTNLVGSQRELKEALNELNQATITKFLQQKNITWKFNSPAASHHGGVWERLIRGVRKILFSILQHQSERLDNESLATLFCEVEAILNGRPIAEMSSDSTDLEALTPKHLLTLRGGDRLPPGIFTANDNYARRRWKQVQYLANLFWSRWVKEYLPLLQERQKWLQPQRNVRENDLVLVMDNSPRNTWSLGRVLETFKCKTGHVRSVRVKTKTNVIVRPIDKLCMVMEAEVKDELESHSQ